MIRKLTLLLLLISIYAGPANNVWSQDLQRSPTHTFQTALQLFQEGLYAEAAPALRRAAEAAETKTVRESAEYYLTLTEIHLDSTLVEEHTEWFVRRYPNSRHSAWLLMDLGHKQRAAGEYRAALNTFERALELPMTQRRKTELIYQLAETAADDQSYDVARSWFLEVAESDPNSAWAPRALYARGRLYLEEEAYDRATDAFELLRRGYPDHVMTRRIGTALGESYYLQDRYEEAIEAFEAAIPDLGGEELTRAVYLIAESFNMLDHLEEASRYYRYYLNRVDDEESARLAHYGLGWVFHKQGIYHWAYQSFERASEGVDETARKVLYYQAVNEKMANQYRRALETFREFGERFQEGLFVERAYYEWALTAMEVGRNVEAIEVLRPLAQNWQQLENPGQVITLLGEAYYANAEYTRAIEAFEIAEELTDIDWEILLQARFQRAWVQYSNQAYNQAQPQFEAVYRESSENSELGGEALFWSADSHYHLGRYGPAAEQYRRFIDQYPNHELGGAARYGLGWSYFMMGDFEQAIDPFVDFQENFDPPSIALYPYETDVQLRIGDSWFALGEYEQALEFYNGAIGAEPGGDYAMFQVANSYYRMNRNFDAVTEFRRLLRIYPYSFLREQAQYNVAYIYLNTGNYDQSIQEFQTVIDRFPQTEWAARSQYNIGDAYYNAGNFEEAIQAYRQVLEQYPSSDYVLEAIDGIQFAQLSGGGDDTSTDVLEEFLADNPTTSTADQLRYRQAENRLRSGDFQAAVDEFRHYIRITNRTDLLPDAHYNLADSYLRTGREELAVEEFNTIVEQFPDSERAASALARLGELSYDKGQYISALEYYRQLSEKGSRYFQESQLGLGRASLAAGNTDAAHSYFESVLEATPDNDAANLGLANVHFAERQYREAREMYRRIAGRNTTEVGAEAQFMIGRTYHEERDFSQALSAYSRVSVLFEAFIEWVAEAKYRSAEIHILQGRRGDAVSLLNDIRDNYPGTDAAVRAANLLERS